MRVRMKGVHKVRRKLADGTVKTHYYAWRGGPRMESDPTSTDFLAEYHRHVSNRNPVIVPCFADLVDQFMDSVHFARLRSRTQADYRYNFKAVLDRFKDLPIAALDEQGIRTVFREWHESMVDTPRTADKRLLAVSKVLSWAASHEIIKSNRILGLEKLYSGDRSDIIWSPDQLARFIHNAPVSLAQAVMLALWTGQRQGDLLKLRWSQYDGETISLVQSKGRRKVRIVVSAELKAMLDGMPKTDVGTILTTQSGKPWKTGFGGQLRKWMHKLGIEGVTFHDLRGTFISVAYANGYSIKQISEASGHMEKTAENIIRKHYMASDLTGKVEQYRVKL